MCCVFDFLLLVVLLLLLLLLLLSFAAVLILGVSLLILDKFGEFSVLFIRRLRRTFFSQVVYALVVLFVTSASDVVQVVKGRFRLFD